MRTDYTITVENLEDVEMSYDNAIDKTSDLALDLPEPQYDVLNDEYELIQFIDGGATSNVWKARS